MRSIIITCLLIFVGTLASGQYTRFPASGIVEYEKTVNMFALLKKKADLDKSTFTASAFEGYKKSQPQFKKLKSTLIFTGNTTLFTPLKDTEVPNIFYIANDPVAEQNNTIFTDLSSSTSIAQKSVYDATFLVKDTIRKITWKITDEIRDIAGYPCRRANAIIMDSIYVVAFYTDKIPVSGGPESFSGLPGLIMGVALPRENVTWFATSVKDMPIPVNTINPPKKGKITDYKGLAATLQSIMKNWGSYAQIRLKTFLL